MSREHFWQTLSQKTRKLARKAERLRQKGEIEFNSIRAGDAWRGHLDSIFELSGRTWAGKEGTSIASTPQLRGFYRELARVASHKGWLHLGLLKWKGRLIAFDYNLVYRGVFYNLKGGYDPEFAQLSPGHMLTWFQLSEALDRKRDIKIFDFLGDADPYKFKWTDAVRNHVKITLYRRSNLQSRFLYILDSQILQKLRPGPKQ